MEISLLSMANDKQKLGKQIQKLRVEHNLSQRQFALMIGMDKTYLSGIENGARNPTFDTLTRVAAGLGVSMKDLFDF